MLVTFPRVVIPPVWNTENPKTPYFIFDVTMTEGEGVSDKLDSVLSNLYDFGDDDDDSRSKRKTKKLPENAQSQEQRKSKQTEKFNGLEEQPVLPIEGSKHKKKSTTLFFESLKYELQSQTNTAHALSKGACNDAVPKQGGQSVQVVTFVNRRDKKKVQKVERERMSETHLNGEEPEEMKDTFNFEKARLEVHKFGITGYQKEKQRTFEQERAIMLGARAPKKEFLNYKVYQEKVKEEKKAKQEESRMGKGTESAKKRKKQNQGEKRTKKTKASGGIVPTGQVGKFKDGALILSSLDIKRIKQSKVIK